MSFSRMARILGTMLILAGIGGFIPLISPHGLLLGLFFVNGAHNLIHLVTGAALLWASFSRECYSLRCFQALGALYGLFGLVGLAFMHRTMLGPVAMSPMDTVLHLLLGSILLYYGFLSKLRLAVVCGSPVAR